MVWVAHRALSCRSFDFVRRWRTSLRMTLFWPMRSVGTAYPAFGHKTIADPGFGLDVLAPGQAVELLAKLADEDAQVLGLVGRLSAPHRGQQRAMGHYLAGIARQVQQQIKFLGGEV